MSVIEDISPVTVHINAEATVVAIGDIGLYLEYCFAAVDVSDIELTADRLYSIGIAVAVAIFGDRALVTIAGAGAHRNVSRIVRTHNGNGHSVCGRAIF